MVTPFRPNAVVIAKKDRFSMFGRNTMINESDSIWDLWIDIGGEG